MNKGERFNAHEFMPILPRRGKSSLFPYWGMPNMLETRILNKNFKSVRLPYYILDELTKARNKLPWRK